MTLLDARGAAALTMRNVAEALGCSQASLYRHVRNRDELVTLLVDRAVSVASASPPEAADWGEKAAWSARSFREHLRRHPGVASLLRGTERLGPNSLAGVEYALELFIGAGFNPKLASAAASSLATYVIGSVHFNIGLDAQDPDENSYRRLLYRSRDASTMPLLVRYADIVADVGSDDEFEVGLNALLTGFRALNENADIAPG